jgi:hypothetical protein
MNKKWEAEVEARHEKQEAIRKTISNPKKFRVKIVCPNCGNAVKITNIDQDKSVEFEKLKCKKCKIEFRWEYFIQPPRPKENWYPRGGTITITMYLPKHRPDIVKYNETHYNFSNK